MSGSGSGPNRSNPFQGLEELFERLSRQFEDAARSWDWDVGSERRTDEHGGSFDPRIGTSTNQLDLAEEDDAFVVTVDVPGYESDDLDVQLSGTVLSVSGERHLDVDEQRENYIRRERRAESFDRQVTLPEPVDDADVEARISNGVLTVRLPKEEPDETHTIEID